MKAFANTLQSIGKGCDHVVSSSGGNAGMAAAYSSKMLGIPATIVIPKSTPSIMISKLAEEKANVIVSSWCKYYIHY